MEKNLLVTETIKIWSLNCGQMKLIVNVHDALTHFFRNYWRHFRGFKGFSLCEKGALIQGLLVFKDSDFYDCDCFWLFQEF